MPRFTGSLAQLFATLFLIVTAVTGLLTPRVAQALPSSCSIAGNKCVAPEKTDWVYTVTPGFSYADLGPFYSEGEAVAAAAALPLGALWCSSSVVNVTYDDNFSHGGTPAFDGSIDVYHGNTIHLMVSSKGIGTGPCNQSWAYNPSLSQRRQVICLPGWTRIYDTSVTPNVPFCQTSSSTFQPAKAPGAKCPPSQVVKANPCDVTNQNKRQIEVDYQGAGANPLRMARTYNSASGIAGVSNLLDTFGAAWSATYFQRLLYSSISVGGTAYVTIYAFRPTGEAVHFNLVSGQWVRLDEDTSDTLTSIMGGGYEYRSADNRVETYDSYGRLVSINAPGEPQQTLTYSGSSFLPSSVNTPFGQSLTFGYTTIQNKPRLTSVTTPSGAVINYAYVASGPDRRLSSVTYPDTTSRVYNSTGVGQLQSITDEAGITYASWIYSGYYGISESLHAGGVEHYKFYYDFSNSKVTVQDPRNVQRTYGFSLKWGVRRATTANGTCGGCREDKSRSYDSNGNVATRTDFNNNQTTYTFDLTRNLETSRTEAFGSPKARTISTTWDAVWRSPATITEPNRTKTFTYDSNGNVLTRTVTDTTAMPNVSRVWTYTYDSYNQVLTADGPRTDVSDTTTYTYYGPSATCVATATGATSTGCRGQLNTITNALSQVTSFDEYNAHGQPVKLTDINGAVTRVDYDARQRVTSREVAGETTNILYWPTGLLKRVTLPDSSYVQYTYDDAHRLYKVEDGDGNRVEYTLDNMSNRTAENAYDPGSTLTRTHTRVFNTLNQLWKDVNAAGTAAVTTVFSYDTQGNQTSVAAPLSRTTSSLYDELNRLKKITDPGSGITLFGYDANDNLTSVTDPRTKVTNYTYDGFGNLTQQVSPDTGTTLNTYDSGNNLATTTDARSKTGTHTYDVLNRVTSIAYPDITTTFTYDFGTNGGGRLTGAYDPNHSLSWTYDAQGRVTGKSQTVGAITKSISYGYSNGNLTSLTTPSGQTITYGYSNGHVASITLNGSTTILNQVLYEPFGPVAGWTWGNSTIAARVHDTDGKPTSFDSAGAYTYGYDDAFRITSIADLADSSKSWTYGYDVLDRLNSASKTAQTIGYTYDANGNRLTQTGTQSAAYTISSSNNRVASISGALIRTYNYDASGNTIGDGTRTFTYRDNGRMTSMTSGGVTTNYVLNALGQRVKKSNSSLTRLFVYDEVGHLLGEYDGVGALIQETIWMGDIPIANLRSNGGGVSIFYVHTDHLNSPRRISRPSDDVVLWRWDADPFGMSAANEDPDGDGTTFVYNLRYPGQYSDSESGLNYNYFRDYDPAVGRYTKSDPIGLWGGLNTYAYVNGNPLWYSDARGLEAGVMSPSWLRPRSAPIPWGRILGKTAARAVPGLGWGLLIYDVCSLAIDYAEKKRCEEAGEACFAECEKHLGEGGDTNQGNPYRNCWVRCMKKANCYKGDSPVE